MTCRVRRSFLFIRTMSVTAPPPKRPISRGLDSSRRDPPLLVRDLVAARRGPLPAGPLLPTRDRGPAPGKAVSFFLLSFLLLHACCPVSGAVVRVGGHWWCQTKTECAARINRTNPTTLQCPNATYRNNTHGASEDDCMPCPAGYECVPGNPEPVPCERGYYCAQGTDPVACQEGTFNSQVHLSGGGRETRLARSIGS